MLNPARSPPVFRERAPPGAFRAGMLRTVLASAGPCAGSRGRQRCGSPVPGKCSPLAMPPTSDASSLIPPTTGDTKGSPEPRMRAWYTRMEEARLWFTVEERTGVYRAAPRVWLGCTLLLGNLVGRLGTTLDGCSAAHSRLGRTAGTPACSLMLLRRGLPWCSPRHTAAAGRSACICSDLWLQLDMTCRYDSPTPTRGMPAHLLAGVELGCSQHGMANRHTALAWCVC